MCRNIGIKFLSWAQREGGDDTLLHKGKDLRERERDLSEKHLVCSISSFRWRVDTAIVVTIDFALLVSCSLALS